ncbi:hypothetical protein GCM10022198_17540 [Klugiella xanthotipulae]|uniref:Uncharacterized protein n=1 Tax=Klugiella xanthotipulae TaxID=244735 RepID=A0A543HXL2_9MICO|nr:hypothetical protein [Klugiella xanthotipulae]TQM63077.1 hypothetical protein FB466_1326 [Klugiella xanthotipulae]
MTNPELDSYSDDNNDHRGRSGLLGRLASARGIAWVVIIGLIALSMGAVGLLLSLQISTG